MPRAAAAVLVLAWWFMAYDLTPASKHVPVSGFDWWVDCEDARHELELVNAFIVTSKCREGQPASAETRR